jgi:hypothetical protein
LGALTDLAGPVVDYIGFQWWRLAGPDAMVTTTVGIEPLIQEIGERKFWARGFAAP